MPISRCENGKYRIGEGECMYTSSESAREAYVAYLASDSEENERNEEDKESWTKKLAEGRSLKLGGDSSLELRIQKILVEIKCNDRIQRIPVEFSLKDNGVIMLSSENFKKQLFFEKIDISLKKNLEKVLAEEPDLLTSETVKEYKKYLKETQSKAKKATKPAATAKPATTESTENDDDVKNELAAGPMKKTIAAKKK